MDQNILEQLRTVFTKLTKPVTIHYYNSDHEKQSELEEMLSGISSTSNLITVIKEDQTVNIPEFYLSHDGVKTGVSFRGIPGGHEFTSLILAILNANGQGKMPDEGIINRIKKLSAFNLKTYVSLSCENCPEVVQSLNLISFLNPKISHQMINGELVTEEVNTLKIQGVPSVILNNQLLLSGKSSLGEILTKLESLSPKTEITPSFLGDFEVAVIGGGPAGVSAAIYAARKGLKVALIADNIGGQVRETKGIENFIGTPYTEGLPLSNQLQEHLSLYPVSVLNHRKVESVHSILNGKKIILTSKETLNTKSIIVATGAKWRELNIPGEKEYLGKGVAFCPHCDGPFYKGKTIAVIGGGNSGVEAALDLSQIVKHVTLIEFNSTLKADAVLVAKLNSTPNITVLTNTKTLQVQGDGDKVTKLQIQRNLETVELPLDGVFVQIGLIPNSHFIKEEVETNKFGEIVVDEKNRTSTPGIYAAGDVTTTPFKQIIISMGEGAKAALSVFEDLIIKNNIYPPQTGMEE